MLWGVFDAEAHPRSCGEHARINETSRFLSGSSPLARGTHHGNLHPAHGPGLIPARAGNTGAGAVSDGGLGAHPRSRSRGEHSHKSLRLFASLGSSPLARGTLVTSARRALTHGLIPACAGNTTIISPPLRHHKAHPRSSGEHSPLTTSKMVVVGSSPLARGTRTGRRPRLPRAGLIPARAGNTT